VVDEAQDIGVAEARFLATLAGGNPNGLFLAGDIGQRIFQQPFSWKALGLDVRGRSFTLRINYRTSHQIRTQADRLLPPSVSDLDGNSESRRGTVSLFDGTEPTVALADTIEDETELVSTWIKARIAEAVRPDEIGLFVRSEAQIARARLAVKASGFQSTLLTEKADVAVDTISVGTMHFAKGLEFRCVAVMACDEDILPLQERIEAVTDESDLKVVYDTERHLLYVACTRARDHLLVTGVEPASEFLTDLGNETWT
jgi:superfamily I DNA/RNA helicase